MAALLRAVRLTQPGFDFASVDIITDRRPVRKLYGFVTGESSSFKFGVAILGKKTALFTRIEDRTREEGPSPGYREYRRAFEEAYLKIPASAKGSTSHHRVVRYVLGRMTFLVRSAVDAYLRDRMGRVEQASGGGEGETSPEELVDILKAMALDEPTPSFTSMRTATVAVIPGGYQVPQAATLELSTRLKRAQNVDLCAEKMPDLWISQTANFLGAYHTYNNHSSTNSRTWASRGRQGGRSGRATRSSGPCLTRFTKIEIKSLKDELVAWETANAKTLGLLVVVIKKVVEASKQIDGTSIVSFDGKERVLVVSRAEEGEVPGLPQELEDYFLQTS